MKRILAPYFDRWWLPAVVYGCLLVAFSVWVDRGLLETFVADALFGLMVLALLGQCAAGLWNLAKRRWVRALAGSALVVVSGAATIAAFLWTYGLLLLFSAIGSSEDGFADDLTIPEGIDIASPSSENTAFLGEPVSGGSDPWQAAVREALSVAGGDSTAFTPAMPSLRIASSQYADAFLAYLEASPDWHVFTERGHRFASRRWSYDGEPRDTLHGYISEFGGDGGFQTRCLLCLDREQWSGYDVQHAQEGTTPVQPEMRVGNHLHESRVMIESGGVWLEIFEQSAALERRVTKATVATVEQEFSVFLADPEGAVEAARDRSRELSRLLAGDDEQAIRLVEGFQPGIYTVVYALNPGEPGSVYLQAFEVTQGTPLSVERLEAASRTRMTWSSEPEERFGAKAGFTIYEGDWGKPYAARFEVWFEPDSGQPERKLAERVFRIEGWQR